MPPGLLSILSTPFLELIASKFSVKNVEIGFTHSLEVMSSHFGIILLAGAGARSRRYHGSDATLDGKCSSGIDRRTKSRISSQDDGAESEAAKRPKSGIIGKAHHRLDLIITCLPR
jgi:hypothetical protein